MTKPTKKEPLKLTFERGGAARFAADPHDARNVIVELTSRRGDVVFVSADRIEWLAFRILGDHVAGLTAVENLHARIVKAAGKARREEETHPDRLRATFADGTAHGLNESARMLRESPIGGWVDLPGDVRLRIEDGQPVELASAPVSGAHSLKANALAAAAKFLGFEVETWSVWSMNPKTRRLHVHVQKAES